MNDTRYAANGRWPMRRTRLALAMTTIAATVTLAGCAGESSPASPQTQARPAAADVDGPAPRGPAHRAGLPTDRDGHEYTNRLIDETSPYLLQHAHNPVDWYPWGEEAFERAKAEDKPIFLSVGYSTCYWCHVMERESFEDEGVAEILNEHFIAIKLDREERPDVDEQYMVATQLTIGRGGWPNSVWMTPDGRPFSAGTYFRRPQFMQILHQTSRAWRTQRDQIERQADELAGRIREVGSGSFAATLRPINQHLIDRATTHLKRTYDRVHGGFGNRPKFPPHGRLRLLAGLYRETSDPELLDIMTGTLDAMALGGVHDHVGGGFHRYATDARWFLPHFEKMLYDNAQLMRAYTDGYIFADKSQKRRYAEVIDHIYFWLQREMTDPSRGVFYSAIDAEVDTVEGQNIVWFTEEVIEVLGEERGRLFAEVYGFEDRGNYVEEASRHRPGNNLPYLRAHLDQIAERRGLDPAGFEADIAQMRAELLEVRDERKQPLLDDKILTSWNAMMIEALAYAGRQLEDSRYIEAAVGAAEGLLELLGPTEDREHFLRVYRSGRAHTPGYLDDHAYLALAMLELHEATGDSRWLDESLWLADAMIEHFADEEDGGFFFSALHHDELILRSKGLSSTGNVPSGNGIASRVLYRLADATGDDRYREAATETLRSLSGMMWRTVHGNEDLLLAAAEHHLDGVATASRRVPATASRREAVARAATDRQAASRDQRREREVAPDRSRPVQRDPAVDPNDLDLTPDTEIEAHPVTIEAYTSRRSIRPGEVFLVAVALDIGSGWHLYGENPEIELLVPTRVSIAESEFFDSLHAFEPRPDRKQDAFFKKELATHSGKVWYLFPVRAEGGPDDGQATLAIDVRTQACDQRRCLPPRTDTMEIQINIDPDGAKGTMRHRDLFTALRSR